ncbi:carbohydrate esterase family 4 protein [Agrocybe pediades]|nr:carbohydrate esterase family 4 protein [Agrocybe pediades]
MFARLLLTSFLAVLASANPTPEKRQTLARVVSSCVNANEVALTFDDGPYIYNTDVVNTLNAAGAKGTFFFNDCIYDQGPASWVLNAFKNGHQIGSHTWAHLDLTTLSWDDIHDQMWKVEQALTKIAGVVPAFMRPPYGNYNNLVRQASAVRGQVLAIWDFDSGDSTGSTVAQSETAYDKLIASKPKNILALNHETEVLPYAIKKLQAAGYKLVTLAECTGLPAYQSQVAPGTRDSTWKC